MKQILIIEDDKTIREELKTLLEQAGYHGVILDDFSNVLEFMLLVEVDLILLDIHLPNINGEVLLREFRKQSNTPVIMVTSLNNEMDEVLSMSYGADDYVTKPYHPTVLLLRIGAVLKRSEQHNDFLQYRDLKVIPAKGVIQKGTVEIILTKNEMIILHFLLTHQGKIITRDELMTDLWNNSEYINDNALSVNISRLRGKLKEAGYSEAIITRKGQGYILQ